MCEDCDYEPSLQDTWARKRARIAAYWQPKRRADAYLVSEAVDRAKPASDQDVPRADRQ